MHYRPASPADAPRLTEIYAHYAETTAITFAEAAPTPEEFRHKMLSGYPFIVCEEGGVVAGFAYASAFREKAAYRWGVELTIYLAPGLQGQGLGSALMQRLLALLKLQGYQTAYSCITLPNERSLALHERFGFRQIGRFDRSGYKLGQWWDVVWVELPLGDFNTPPQEPTSIAELSKKQIMDILER